MSNQERYSGRLCVLQGTLTDYRALLLDELATCCDGGLDILASQPAKSLQIKTAESLEHATFTPSKSRLFFKGPIQMQWQSGVSQWLDAQAPDALVAEANSRLFSSRVARSWMQRRKRPVIGWGLGTMVMSSGLDRLRSLGRTRFINGFDAMLAYSSKAAEDYAAVGFPESKIFVAFNACTKRPQTSMPARAADFGERPNVLYVGRMVAGKRLEDLVRACAAMPSDKQPMLTFVGDGPAREAAQALAREIYPRAEFAGGKFGRELDGYFQRADLFVLPGLGGLAIQQAMAHGLPVIVAEGDGTQFDLIREGRNGWHVRPGDVQQLMSLINEAFLDVDRLRAMGAESFRIVREEINIENMVETFIRAIHSVA